MTAENRNAMSNIVKNMNTTASKDKGVKAYMPMAYIIPRDHDYHICRFAWNNDYIPVLDMTMQADPCEDTNTPENIIRHRTAKIALMGKCDEVWVVTDPFARPLSGIDGDVIDRAKLRHKKIRYFKYLPYGEDRLYFEEVGGFEG